jgi:hypothetical protein
MLTAIRNSSATMVPRSAQQPRPTSMTMDICGPGNVSHLTTSFGRQRQKNAHYIKRLLDIASDLQDKAQTFSRLFMQPRHRRNHANFIALAVAVGTMAPREGCGELSPPGRACRHRRLG